MAKDLTVILEDHPGTLADMGEALGKAGINIDGLCGFPCQGKGTIHILVEDAAAARRALEERGLEVRDERERARLETGSLADLRAAERPRRRAAFALLIIVPLLLSIGLGIACYQLRSAKLASQRAVATQPATLRNDGG